MKHSQVCLILDDKTGDERTPDELEQLYSALRGVVETHGFKMSSCGSKESLIRFLSITHNPDGTPKNL